MIFASRSCSPRCASGRAISQSRRPDISGLGDLKYAVDLDCSVPRQDGDADSGPRMAPFVSEYRHHHVGGAVHDLRTLEKPGIGIDEAAKADHARDPVEIAERG